MTALGQMSSTPGPATGTPRWPAASTRCLKLFVNQAGGGFLGCDTRAADAVAAAPRPIAATTASTNTTRNPRISPLPPILVGRYLPRLSAGKKKPPPPDTPIRCRAGPPPAPA